MKTYYAIYKHIKGIGMTRDIDLSEYEDGFEMDNLYDAEKCCRDMNKINKDANYYWVERRY